MPEPVPFLLVNQGPLAGRRFPVESELYLGRENADLTVEDPLISRRHARFRPIEGVIEIEDLGSLNGTWVNGERIGEARRLQAGDVVTVGGTSLVVQADPAERGMTMKAPSPLAQATEPPVPSSHAVQHDEVRTVTALFADIVGSTSLGERLPAHDVKMLIGECVSRMTHAVERYGGEVQAFMGDGIAAFFGVPVAHEDDPERAARAALAILDVVAEYAREVEAAWGISDFNARVGINSGEMAIGLVGAADPQSVSLGDTANVAARLQSAAEPGTIAAGRFTARALLHGFVLEPLGDLNLKGREEPVEAWRLVCAQTAASAAAPTPIVGRDREVERLRGILDGLTEGRGRILFLVGDAGIGKTRLLSELRALAEDRVTWLEGRCYSYGTDLLYGPFIEMLRSWAGMEEGEAELSARTKLRAKLDLIPVAALSAATPFLCRLLSLRLDPDAERRMRELTPMELVAEIRGAYRMWVTALVQQGPVVIAVDDLHWADTSTCELTRDLLDLADLAPVLLVVTSRADPSSEGWQLRAQVLTDYSHRADELALGPLHDAASRALLTALPASRALGEAEFEMVVAGAEGNPLYLEELLTAFAQGSRVPRGQTTFGLTVTGRALTPTLESLLLARVDRLSTSARRLAQIAAIIGRSFPLRALEQIAEIEDVGRDLAVLIRADIVRELRRYPEPEYTFRHGLLREVCLSTLPPERRRELYGVVGAAFERLFADALDDHLEVIAHYYARSHERRKALDYLERAGERAAALDAVSRAGELWGRAAKVAERLEDADAERRLKGYIDALEARTGERFWPPAADSESQA
jgi:class 3 adenylate cyclase